MKEIIGKKFGEERALYGTHFAKIESCRFEGEEDGESALKECGNVAVVKSFFDLRYPLWHVSNAVLYQSEMTENCRAPMWYDNVLSIGDCRLHGIKALRECKNVDIQNCDIVSPEFGWKCSNVEICDSSLTSEYAFLSSNGIDIDNLEFQGKYSFQYTKNVVICNSVLKTKDAFWHAKNVTVVNSTVEGEYLGWYSDKLTFINCHIKGTQPLCYCNNLRLVNCTMESTDLAFEYSVVNATVSGNVESIKNPRRGRIVCDSVGELILTSDGVYKCKAKVITNK